MNLKRIKAGFSIWMELNKYKLIMLRCSIKGHIIERKYYTIYRDDEYKYTIFRDKGHGERKYYNQCKRCSQIIFMVDWNDKIIG